MLLLLSLLKSTLIETFQEFLINFKRRAIIKKYIDYGRNLSLDDILKIIKLEDILYVVNSNISSKLFISITVDTFIEDLELDDKLEQSNTELIIFGWIYSGYPLVNKTNLKIALLNFIEGSSSTGETL
jgi:hypothetical protein